MRYQIHTQVTSVDLEPVSVILGADKDQPDGIKMMHCIRCGEKMIQYQGRVMAIYPGLSPVLKLPLFHRCQRCKETYAIGSVSW